MNPTNYRKELTEKIIQQLEAGTAPWVKPWTPGMALPGAAHNAVTERPYHGGNQLWLSCQGYTDPRWCTYKQAAEQGWQVHKGEKATSVEYWQWTENKRDDQGKLVEVKLEHPRVFYASVFNAAQMENVPEYEPEALAWVPEEAAERIITNSGAVIRYDQIDSAFFSPSRDSIHMPPRSFFADASSMYSVVLHELCHWTSGPTRIFRDIANRFGTPEYAQEELIAEISSYFLASRLGIPHDPGQHAAYIQSWIGALKNDHNEIFRAAKEAEKITEYLLTFQHDKVQEQQTPATITPSSPSAKPTRERKPSKDLELEC